MSELLRRTPLPDQAARAIKQYVGTKALMPGDQLPSERELTELLGVSRTVVREGLQALVAEGLLMKEPSKGVFVRGFDAQHIREQLAEDQQSPPAIRSLLEVRAALEIGALPFIAQRISPNELTELAEIVAEMRRRLATGQPLIKPDRDFHELLERATHNPSFIYFKRLVQDAIQSAAQGMTLSYTSSLDRNSVEGAEALLAALQRKDIDHGQRAMRAHLLIDRPSEQARVFLFVDDGEIAEMQKLRRRITPAHNHPLNPLLSAEFPWEGDSLLPSATVIYDRERLLYQLWYHGYRALSPREEVSSLCYATSIDGIHWHKPALDLLDKELAQQHQAWESNLLIPWGNPTQGDVTSATILYDSQSDWRYKMVYFGAGIHSIGVCLAISVDGLHWNPLPENPVETGGNEPVGDALYCLPDTDTNRVVAYYRIPRRTRPTSAVGRMESQDLRHWHKQQVVLNTDTDDPPDAELVGLTPFRYGELTLGLLWVQRRAQGAIELQLACSRNGIQWTRVGDRTPFLTTGGVGAFDQSAIVRATIPIVNNDELWFYYAGADQPLTGWQPSTYRIGLATLALDRFVALEASREEGSLTTQPIPCNDQTQLLINAVVNPGGYLLVEVLDGDGRPIAGFTRADALPFGESAIYHPYSWQAHTDLRSLAGRTLKFHFILCQTSFYAFRLVQPNAGPSD